MYGTIVKTLVAIAFLTVWSYAFRKSIISRHGSSRYILKHITSTRDQIKQILQASSGDSVDNVRSSVHPMRVAYQGEPGAYSEKASRELLGSRIITVPCPSFESVFKAVAAKEVDYAVVPIENSLGMYAALPYSPHCYYC